MKIKNIKEKLIYTFLFFLLIAVDQVSKFFVVSRGSCDATQCSYFKNDNFAFSLKVPHALAYFIYFGLILSLIVWFTRKVEKTLFQKISFTLILAGAFSNIGERIANGFVVDFIRIHTGVLNLADFFILLGIIILLFEKPETKT
jgi:lipoprotein signal peptidase